MAIYEKMLTKRSENSFAFIILIIITYPFMAGLYIALLFLAGFKSIIVHDRKRPIR